MLTEGITVGGVAHGNGRGGLPGEGLAVEGAHAVGGGGLLEGHLHLLPPLGLVLQRLLQFPLGLLLLLQTLLDDGWRREGREDGRGGRRERRKKRREWDCGGGGRGRGVVEREGDRIISVAR